MRIAFWMLALALVPTPSQAAAPLDSTTLATRIDGHVNARLRAAGVEPAPRADDAEFFRRVSLDLTGRIPHPRDVRDFVADNRPDKRQVIVDRLLANPRHAAHFANLWRAALLPEATVGGEARFLQPGFELWLRQRLRAGARHDQLVRELLTVPIPTDASTAQQTLQRPGEPTPLAFFAAKEARPENLAAAVSRTFLGIQLECAQCHDHPFAEWSRQQFWQQAAFFAGLERRGNGLFAPLTETIAKRELVPMGSQKTVQAAFLDGTPRDWQPDDSPRTVLARWVTAKENPYFAKATVNRLWGQLFGVGLVEPVDDFHAENPPSHPELLEELGRAFADSGFDTAVLLRALCATETYQRTSARTAEGQDDPRLFARAAVRGLTGEQFFDSLALAIGHREPTTESGAFADNRRSVRQQFLSRFALQGKPSEPQTSILQALSLMNGRFLSDATRLDRSATLQAIVENPHLDEAGRVEALYLAALSRLPSAPERKRAADYLQGTGPFAERFEDLFWALLNTVEFRTNH